MSTPDTVVRITRWPSLTASVGTMDTTTWPALFDSLRTPTVCEDKRSLGGWSPGVFKGNHRAKDDCTGISAIVLDYDSSAAYVAPEVAEIAASWSPFSGIVHSSHSHQRQTDKNVHAGPCARVVLVLSREATPVEYGRLWSWAAQRARDHGHQLDEGTRDPSRLWFLPSIVPGAKYEVQDLVGDVIDVDAVLAYTGPDSIIDDSAARSPAADDAQPTHGDAPGSAAGPMGRLFAALLRTSKARDYGSRGVAVLCPFHDDNEPSAIVFRVTGDLHCSACNRRWRMRQWLRTPQVEAMVGADCIRSVLGRDEAPPPALVIAPDEPREPPWPAPMAPAAYHGLAGDIVRAVEPHTEADSVAILVQLLVAAGNIIGRRAHFIVESTRHYMNLFTVLLGPTAKGRKGTAWDRVRGVLPEGAAGWGKSNIQKGLASGEGLIWAVRDSITTIVKGKEVEDPGVKDKRLLVYETEFARVVRIIGRENSTLSAVLREAWDSGDLRNLTKTNPSSASDAHLSLVGHITRDELRRHLAETEVANGFGNRILWVCSRRARVLPFGGQPDPAELAPLTAKLEAAIRYGCELPDGGCMDMDAAARARWCEVYPALSEGRPGMVGALTARAEAHARRLACIYALLDQQPIVGLVHLEAALAVVRYVADSVRYAFGDAVGDPVADEILGALRRATTGLTRTEIRDLFGRNRASHDIDRALGVLLTHGLADVRREDTGGRPAERWFATADRSGVSSERPGTTETTDTTKGPGACPQTSTGNTTETTNTTEGSETSPPPSSSAPTTETTETSEASTSGNL